MRAGTRHSLRALALLGGVAVAACAAQVRPDGQRLLTTPGAIGPVSVPVSTFAERRFLTIVRQQYDFSCGSAALATLLRYHYGEARSEESVFLGMFRDGDRAAIRRVGFSLLDMKRFLAAEHLRADGFRVSLPEIEKAGVPGIALIDVGGYKHFVVLKGIQGDDLLLGDPALGLRTIDRKLFLKQWNGIYFVINDRLPLGRAQWSGPRQWAAYVRAPISSLNPFTQPLSNQSLFLTTPGFGEF